MTNQPTPRSDDAVTVIMPAYNEEAGIEGAVAEICSDILDGGPDRYLLVVNDGSRDGTLQKLRQLAAADSRITVLDQPNAGHGGAVMNGMDAANTPWLFLIDADQQIPARQFASFWQATHEGGFDAAFGYRRRRHDPRIRLILTRIIALALPILFGMRLRDANVPFKLVRRTDWQAARACIPAGTLAPSLFLALWMAKHRNVSVIEVDHLIRTKGVGSIRRWKLFKFTAKAFRQLLRFRWSLAGSSSS